MLGTKKNNKLLFSLCAFSKMHNRWLLQEMMANNNNWILMNSHKINMASKHDEIGSRLCSGKDCNEQLSYSIEIIKMASFVSSINGLSGCHTTMGIRVCRNLCVTDSMELRQSDSHPETCTLQDAVPDTKKLLRILPTSTWLGCQSIFQHFKTWLIFKIRSTFICKLISDCTTGIEHGCGPVGGFISHRNGHHKLLNHRYY